MLCSVLPLVLCLGLFSAHFSMVGAPLCSWARARSLPSATLPDAAPELKALPALQMSPVGSL